MGFTVFHCLFVVPGCQVCNFVGIQDFDSCNCCSNIRRNLDMWSTDNMVSDMDYNKDSSHLEDNFHRNFLVVTEKSLNMETAAVCPRSQE